MARYAVGAQQKHRIRNCAAAFIVFDGQQEFGTIEDDSQCFPYIINRNSFLNVMNYNWDSHSKRTKFPCDKMYNQHLSLSTCLHSNISHVLHTYILYEPFFPTNFLLDINIREKFVPFLHSRYLSRRVFP